MKERIRKIKLKQDMREEREGERGERGEERTRESSCLST